MSKFSKFMKANKVKKENEFYAPTKSLLDENGDPIKWEFRHITSKENEIIREECTVDVPVVGKPNVYRPKIKTSLFIQKLITASVIMPDLYDVELQDSYSVRTPEDLLLALVDDPGEYNDLAAFVQRMQGYDVSFDDKIEEAKN